MDWVEFFEKTRQAAGVESFAKLAPKLGISDGAISHYRTGKRVPQVWVVAECLKIQGHPQPEKAAIQIMKSEAQTSPERHFWKRLAATAMALMLAVGFALPHEVQAMPQPGNALHDIHYAKCCIGLSVRSCPPRGNGWASGLALACTLSPRPRMR
ncbi:hypothetical protein CEE61_02235 [Stenotrophomonas maltophilia]|uniref:DUF3693 domain-containing protein n=2 Tax=Lysobacteraceae TaxID=32033 RepID=UPI000B4D7E9D|nr:MULTISPECIES: DUF3693 domain-containing protein [unclassified Stenotrophomonas]OWQ62933.1 hypothetical protein CEE61_02235 [Stenotrophomonas maltophilia]MRE90129.1 hypothetical protein [Stenotrophomonas sp. M37]MRF20331.1 hypothetical protein [Stenotrophomonas sp. MY18]MRF51044.1 hypothetical protein [Stenotrophomonas sp. MY15]MRG14322.1 hypothetical protein [Stenotrophomonas sp. MY17]